MNKVLPDAAGRVIALLICISALGAVNGLIFTGARISYALGADHRSFRPLGTWSGRLGTPVWALLVQGGLALAIVLAAGSFIDTILYTASVVWAFFLATALSVFVLRRKEPHILRPYRITGYPLVPLVFAASCLFMLYSSAAYALTTRPLSLLILLAILLVGAIIYWLTEIRNQGKNDHTPE
jgi:APA family basic amino acid/polyamine antiporter